MAAVTLLGSSVVTTNSTAVNVTATPTAGSLIIIIASGTGDNGSPQANVAANISDNQSGSYVYLAGALKNTSADDVVIYARTASASAVSTTFTFNPTANGATTTGQGIVVLQVTGMSRFGSNAQRGTGGIQNNAAAGGTPAPVLSGAPLTGNPIIGAITNASNPATLTPRTGFTEHVDTGYNTPATGLEVMSRDSGETTATQTWGGTSASAFGAVVVELDTSAGPISGTLSGTLGAVTSSSAAKLAIQATENNTLAAVTLSSSSKLALQATASNTLAAVTLSSNSKVAIQGTLTGTLDVATVSSSAVVAIKGTETNTLNPVTLSSTAALALKANTTNTLADVTLSSTSALTGGNASLGNLTTTLETLSLSSSSTVSIQSSSSITLGNVIVSSSGLVKIGGGANDNLAPLTVASTGSLKISGSFSSTLDPLTLLSTTTISTPNFGSLNKTLDSIIIDAHFAQTPFHDPRRGVPLNQYKQYKTVRQIRYGYRR